MDRPLKQFELDFIRDSSSAMTISTGRTKLASDETRPETVSRLVTQWTMEEYNVAENENDWVDHSSDEGSLADFDLTAMEFDPTDKDRENFVGEQFNAPKEENYLKHPEPVTPLFSAGSGLFSRGKRSGERSE